MSPRRTAQVTGHEYRVRVTAWDIYEVWVTASNDEVAQQAAEKLWHDVGPDAFYICDSGVEEIEIMNIREVVR